MKLRTRLDVFSTALLSALGATQLAACGGSAVVPGEASAGSGNVAGTSTGGASTGGSGRGGGASAGTPGSGGAGANKYPCLNPREPASGLVTCDTFRHRQTVETCATQIPRPAPVPNQTATGGCKSDAECTERPYGWCSNSQEFGNYCNYGCVKDSDCSPNQLCECSDPVGRCVFASCASDADCVPGFLCRTYDSKPGCYELAYSCQAPADQCGSNADCTEGAALHCLFEATVGRFQCADATCAVGRPFLVEGIERLAPAAERTDWSELAVLPRLTALDAVLRTRLAEQWTHIALMEHASIAAFARFTLQLLSLGAPASLIEQATAAMADETRHAKACFALASHYAAAPLGPGSLAVERSLDESSLTEIVLNTIREGCVGETVAAIEAREAAEHAADPAVRELLIRISEDETRHAELAYRFVKWALPLGGPELKSAVRAEFGALTSEAPPARARLTDSDHDLLRHGIASQATRRAIRAQAIAEVIVPCARALFGAEARPLQYAESSI